MLLNDMQEHCDMCGTEMEVGRIGLCDFCQHDAEVAAGTSEVEVFDEPV